MVTLDDIEAQREIVNDLFDLYHLLELKRDVIYPKLLAESRKLEQMMEEFMHPQP